jgi:hypothetical protein
MPTHKIHLAIAKKVNDKLKLDLDQIMLGSVLPDIVEGKNHQIAHFQHGEKDLEGLANPDEFVKKYKNKLDNPIMIGFLIHILSDRFYNEYFFKNFYIYDEDDNGIGMFLKGKRKLLNDKERKNLKHREMFIYDRWLLNHNFVPKFKNYECIDKVENIDEMNFNKDKLKEYIKSANNDVDKVNIFSKIFIYNYKITGQKELDKIFHDCIDYILKYLNDLNIM